MEAFFASGRRTAETLVDQLDEQGLLPASRQSLLRDGRALDFGCGVGRLTQALCGHFQAAIGVDISPTMVRLADEHNRFGDRCRYVVNAAADLGVLKDGRFDLCYSLIVLQHMPWEAARGYLADMARRLTPRGRLVFQLPAAHTPPPPRTPLHALARRVLPETCRRLRRRWRDPLAARMQMHATPRPTVEAFLASLGLEVLYVRESDDAGPGYASWLYVAGRGERA
ncbi:MAG: class I SAM-dependent methyltransferase [Planctomycetota bacterium]